jgi:hypothetical protein
VVGERGPEYGEGDGRDCQNVPGREIMVVSHVLHHLVHRPVLFDIQAVACLPMLLPAVNHGELSTGWTLIRRRLAVCDGFSCGMPELCAVGLKRTLQPASLHCLTHCLHTVSSRPSPFPSTLGNLNGVDEEQRFIKGFNISTIGNGIKGKHSFDLRLQPCSRIVACTFFPCWLVSLRSGQSQPLSIP